MTAICPVARDALLIYLAGPRLMRTTPSGRARWLENTERPADANRRLQPRYRVELRMRVAIHTGRCGGGDGAGVVRNSCAGLPHPMSQRVCRLWPRRQRVISGQQPLVQGYFTMSDLRVQASRGLQPVQVYHVLRKVEPSIALSGERRGLTPVSSARDRSDRAGDAGQLCARA